MALGLEGGIIRLRPGQAEAVQQIKAAFERGIKTAFLDAPVGSGKSLVNLLVARDMLGAYISTPQVILVNQYGADTEDGAKFSGLARTLYGRRNYPCTHLQSLPVEEGGRPYATAAGAPCTYLAGWSRECPDFVACPYYSAKKLAQVHRQTVTTMAYLLIGIRSGLDHPNSGWNEKPLLVIDEAHGLSEDLVRFFKAEIGPKTLPGFRKKWLESPADPRFRLIESLPSYIDRLRQVESSLQQNGEQTRKVRERIERLHSAIALAEDVFYKLRIGTVEWVHTYESRRSKHTWKPLAVRSMMAQFWGHFNHILLSSATFFGIEQMVGDTGLPTPIERVVVPDTFSPERAPIRLLGAARLGYKADPFEIERAADAVAAVANAHPSERGVIHANSYRLANAIRGYLPPSVRQRLTSHDPANRVRRYDRWRADPSPNAIFLAVAMNQGIDLFGDLARWQVLVKVPFPNLDDAWVRRRKEQEDGDGWYKGRTMIEVLQTCGRIMRAPDDHGMTYVVDTQLEGLVEHGWADLPEWFRRRVTAGRRLRVSLPGKFGDYGKPVSRSGLPAS
jgi:Rad3-related DNA helicase